MSRLLLDFVDLSWTYAVENTAHSIIWSLKALGLKNDHVSQGATTVPSMAGYRAQPSSRRGDPRRLLLQPLRQQFHADSAEVPNTDDEDDTEEVDQDFLNFMSHGGIEVLIDNVARSLKLHPSHKLFFIAIFPWYQWDFGQVNPRPRQR